MIDIPKGKERLEKEYFKKIITENIPELMTDNIAHIQEAQRTLSRDKQIS